MKTLRYVFALAIVGIFAGLNCCSEKEVEPMDLKAEFEESAKLHTEAMKELYSSLKAEQPMNGNELTKVKEETTKEFISRNIVKFQNLKEAPNICRSECQRLMDYSNNQTLPLASKADEQSDFLNGTIEAYREHLTEAQVDLLLKIHDAFLNCEDPEEIIVVLSEIKDVDCLALPPEERNYIYAATTIGIESIAYWSENLDEWLKTLSNQKSSQLEGDYLKGWFDWKKVGNEDISGAVGGAIGGAVVGAVAGGVGAGPGAVAGGVAGGIGSSATSAVNQLIKRYF